jgi:hypothetical protein
VILEWTTATEIENRLFTLERSSDTKNWHVVGTVPGAGNSSVAIDYEFTDQNPLNKVSYYRLKQTDWDGTSTRSQVKSVDFSSDAAGFTVYPNPAEGFARLYIEEQDDEELQVEIYSIEGKFMSGNVLTSNQIDLQHLTPGIYFVKITSANGNSLGIKRLVVK